MRRRHLFEFTDQAWLPGRLRRSVLEVLQHDIATSRMYAPIVEVLREALAESSCTHIVDFGSGGGATALQVQAMLGEAGCPVSLTMTDKYPAADAVASAELVGSPAAAYHPVPVDALRPPAGLDGFRTFFTSFHHFPPARAAAILRRAVEDRAPLGVFEFTQRRLANVAGTLLSPISVMRSLQEVRRSGRAGLSSTALLPLAALVYAWDGAVSHLRTYTVDELQQLIDMAGRRGFRWEVGQAGGSEYPITYLVGLPA